MSARRAKLFRLHSSTAPPRVLRAAVRPYREVAVGSPDPRREAGRPALVVVPGPLLVGRQGPVGRGRPDDRPRGGSRPQAAGGSDGEGACGHPRRARDGHAAAASRPGRALRRVVPRPGALRRLRREGARRLRSDPSLRRRRVRRAAEHRASLRALQAAPRGERGARPGHPSSGRRGYLLSLGEPTSSPVSFASTSLAGIRSAPRLLSVSLTARISPFLTAL